ncbi:hypothetical protein Dimus_000166 [Dionaea muscipula]
MEASAGASIIANLESSNYGEIHNLCSNFLHPITLLNSKPQNPTKSKRKQVPSSSSHSSSSTSIRSLAKTYLPFLNQVLSLIPKRLCQSPKLLEVERFSSELFCAYRQCLDCLELISSELAAKLYTVHSHRTRFVSCLVYWSRYEEGWVEGFRVLKCLKGSGSEGDGFLPCLDGDGGVEEGFAHLVVDVVVMIVQCLSLSKTNEESKYWDVLSLVVQVKPWFRVLDASRYMRFHRKILAYMGKATTFLFKEPDSFEGNLFAKFSVTTFDEYIEFLKDQEEKEIVFKVSVELLDIVSHCAYGYHAASSNTCSDVAKYLYEMDIAPFCFLTKLYAVGMLISDKSNPCSKTSSSLIGISTIKLLLDCQGKLQHLSSILGSKKTRYCAGLNAIYKSLGCNCECSVSMDSSHVVFDKALEACSQDIKKVYLSIYLKALKYFCRPLSHFVYSKRNIMLTEEQGFPVESSLRKLTEDIFLRYCDTFFCCHSCTSTGERHDLGEALSIFLASFILSLKRHHDSKKSVKLMKHLIADKCIRPEELKFLIARLNNIGVDCYRGSLLKEASKAVKLCCRACWTLLCQMLVNEHNSCHNKLPDNVIEDLLKEASAKSAFLLEIVYQFDKCKIGKVIEYTLEQWLVARCLSQKLPCPEALVKQWVKVQIKSYRSLDVEADEQILFTYLSNSSTPGHTFAPILEQELIAYQEMSATLPTFCQNMQRRIVDILLDDIYVSQSSWFQRADALIKKAMILRTCGIEGLEECIWCLSEAIKTIDGSCRKADGEVVSHQLAVAHCIRALCTYEDLSNSKQAFGGAVKKEKHIMDDIRAALAIWLSTDFDSFLNALSDMEYQDFLLLLYHLIDLLSIKGIMSFHSDIYNLMVKLFSQMHVPPEKCLVILWECRRLNHALCISPICEASVLCFSRHYTDAFKSIDHWINCFSDSEELLVGFQQSFSFLSSYFPESFHRCKNSFPAVVKVSQVKEVTAEVDSVKEIALRLISNVPVPSRSAFLAGYLFYDLSDRLVYCGQLIEALVWAKESYQLRSKLLHENFQYMFEQHKEIYDETGEGISKQPFCVSYFQVCNQVAAKAWPCNVVSPDPDCCNLTPWKVLQCYLESTLQVGVIHEMIGNGAEAEALFHVGKTISCKLGLPLFTVAFSSGLGKLYRNKQLYDLAKKELHSAKQVVEMLAKSVDEKVLAEKNGSIFGTCLRCQLILDSAVNEETGKLYRIHLFFTSESSSIELSDVEELYQSSLTRLNYTKWKNLCEGIKDAERDQVSKFADTRYAVAKANTIGCLECSPSKLAKSSSIVYFMHLKWEFARRREMLRLLMGLGECREGVGEVHELHEVFCKSVAILLGDDPSCNCHHYGSRPLELTFLDQHIHGDIFSIERASVLYTICWFSLKSLLSDDTRISCCYLCGIQTPKIVSLLKLAFVLSREVPVLFQKVSQLLAIVYVISAAREDFSSPLSRKLPSENYWAAYYHQVSVGTHNSHSLFCTMAARCKSQVVPDTKGSEAAEQTCRSADGHNFVRLAPESTEYIEGFIEYFFESLPCATVVCMSFLGGAYLCLLKELLPYSSHAPAWMLLSRLNANSQPVVILIPLNSVLKGDGANFSSSTFGGANIIKSWNCPWGYTVVDEIAPVFKSILRQNYISTAHYPPEDTKENRETWWRQRTQLDDCLSNLLRDMEQSWFGPWKYLLLGKLLDSSPLNDAMKQLKRHLKLRCKLNVNESLLEVILEGVKFFNWEKGSIAHLLEKGCYIGKASKKASEDTSKLVSELNNVEENHSIGAAEPRRQREQVILVLDSDVQMLPWESMPMLREQEQEVYRMPSVACMSVALHRSAEHQEEAQSLQAVFPLIDPLDAFYLLNPSGDLSSTQEEFEEWFKAEQLQGKAGVSPTSEELSVALRNHDLYLYFGHGSGAQYIPLNEIQKLEDCAAAALMGCSSGSVLLNGCYTPQSTAYSYLLAGSPVVVANLWEVTDKDIDRFGKSLLKAWVVERSTTSSTKCFNCRLLAEALDSVDLNRGTRSGKSSARGKKKKSKEDGGDGTCRNCCRPKHKVGYFISKARDTCRLKYLTGAAPVCYGVPTGITRKKD